MSATDIVESITSIIPVATTVAVAGFALKTFGKPIKKSKAKFNWW